MLFKALIFWVVGLFTVVPYSVYYLLFHAQRHQYALLIVLPLFWIFGFWGVAGPVIILGKIHTLYRSFGKIGTQEELREMLHNEDARDVAIDLIASENKIPKFMAKMIYSKAIERLLRDGSSLKPD